MVVIMENAVFWDVAPRGSGYNRPLGGKRFLHLQGRKNQLESLLVTDNVVPIIFSP
jgi:hypothetical protein